MAWHLYTGKKDRLDIGDGQTISAKRAYVDESGDYHTRRQFLKHTHHGQTPETLAKQNKAILKQAVESGQLIPVGPRGTRGHQKYLNPMTGDTVAGKKAIDVPRNKEWDISGHMRERLSEAGRNDRYLPLLQQYAFIHGLHEDEARFILDPNTEEGKNFIALFALLDETRSFKNLSIDQRLKIYARIRVIMSDLGFDNQSDYHDAFYM